MKLNELKGTITIIGRFSIRAVGSSTEVWAMRKKEKKDGTKSIEPDRLGSHGYLTWCLKNILRVGNKTEKGIAGDHLEKFNKKVAKIKERGTDDYMVAYRKLEKKYIENGFK